MRYLIALMVLGMAGCMTKGAGLSPNVQINECPEVVLDEMREYMKWLKEEKQLRENQPLSKSSR